MNPVSPRQCPIDDLPDDVIDRVLSLARFLRRLGGAGRFDLDRLDPCDAAAAFDAVACGTVVMTEVPGYSSSVFEIRLAGERGRT